jgi:hypothetical protein
VGLFLRRAPVRRGGTLFLDPRAALELVGMARRRGVRVLGIDTFVLTDTETRPLLDHIADYSSATSSWDAAEAFIRGRATHGFMFEVVLE